MAKIIKFTGADKEKIRQFGWPFVCGSIDFDLGVPFAKCELHNLEKISLWRQGWLVKYKEFLNAQLT